MYEELIEGIFESEDDEEIFQNAVNDGNFFLPVGVVPNVNNKFSYFNRYTLGINENFEKDVELIHEHDGRVGVYISPDDENPSLLCAHLNDGDRVTLHHEVEELSNMKEFFIENNVQISIFIPKNHSDYEMWSSDDYVTIVNEKKAYLPDMDVPLDDNLTVSYGIIDVSAFFDKDKQTLDEKRLRNVTGSSIIFLSDIINNATFPTEDIETAMVENYPILLSIAGVNELYDAVEKKQAFTTLMKNIVSIISTEGQEKTDFVKTEYNQNVTLYTAVPSMYNLLPETKESDITMGIDISYNSTMLKRKIHNIVKKEFNGIVFMFYDKEYLSSPPNLKSVTTERSTPFEKLVKDKVEKTSVDVKKVIESENEAHDEAKIVVEDNEPVEDLKLQCEDDVHVHVNSGLTNEPVKTTTLKPVIKIMKYELDCGYISLKEDTSHSMNKYDFEVEYCDREIECPVMKNITGIMLTANIHGIPLINAVGNLVCDCDDKFKCINVITSIINNGEL